MAPGAVSCMQNIFLVFKTILRVSPHCKEHWKSEKHYTVQPYAMQPARKSTPYRFVLKKNLMDKFFCPS